MIIRNIRKIMNIKLGNIIPNILSWIQPTLSTAINGMDWRSVTWSPELGRFVAAAAGAWYY